VKSLLILALLFIARVASSAEVNEGTQISFAQAYAKMISRDLDLQRASLVIANSEAARLKSFGQFTPSLGIEYDEKKIAEPLTKTRSAALTSSINLFRSGADVAGVRAANRSLDASQQAFLTARQKVEFAAVDTLMTLLSAVHQVEVQRKLVLIQSDLLRVARERFQRGLLPRQESDKIQIDLENARASLRIPKLI
jgi:outer membrane protein TolC